MYDDDDDHNYVDDEQKKKLKREPRKAKQFFFSFLIREFMTTKTLRRKTRNKSVQWKFNKTRKEKLVFTIIKSGF